MAAIPLIIRALGEALRVCKCGEANVFEFLADLWQWLTKEIAQSSPLDLLVKLLAIIAATALIYYVQKLLRKRLAWARAVLPSFWASHRKINRIRNAVHEQGPGLWLAIKHNPHPPSTIDTLQNTSKLILTVANLKGGVGKTTLTANLAAFFANPFNDSSRPSRRVLVIDFDFQGSCSSMLFANTDWRPGNNQLSHASELISGTPLTRGQLGQPVGGINGVSGISAFYDVASTENREMIRWLMGDEKNDIRYRLAHLLVSDEVLNNFDVILIDAPPRLTTASVQALCASTHVLIPTILDPLSSDDPVGYFGHQLKAHQELWPQLKVMGVIGTLTQLQFRGQEEPALIGAGDRLRTALEGANGCLRYVETKNTCFEFPYDCSVKKSAPLARAAGQGVPYVAIGDDGMARIVRTMFDKFGREVDRRWHL